MRPGNCPRRRLLASAAVLAVTAAAGATMGAGPAAAHDEPDGHGKVTVTPAGDLTSTPRVSGRFEGASLLGLGVELINSITITVSPTGPTGGEPLSVDGCEHVTEGKCGSVAVGYAWDIPDLDYNGPYSVSATAGHCLSVCVSPSTARTTPVAFRLGVDPRAPTDLRVSTNEQRGVAVSWARNPEPDILHYALFRKDPGGDFRRVGGNIRQPASGRPTFNDTGTAGTNGGEFVYRVFAVRVGFSGDDTTTRTSRASADRSVTVAPPPITTAGPTDPAGTQVPVAGQGVDLDSFLSNQAPARPSPPPIFLDIPDTGFDGTLPFGSLPIDEAEPGGDAVPPTPRQRQIAEFQRNRPLIPVAAGAILILLAAHVRLLNARSKAADVLAAGPRPAKKARAVGEGVARPTVRVLDGPAVPTPADLRAVVADGGQHRDSAYDMERDMERDRERDMERDMDMDLADLPVWAEFEPAAALGLFDESADEGGVLGRAGLERQAVVGEGPEWAAEIEPDHEGAIEAPLDAGIEPDLDSGWGPDWGPGWDGAPEPARRGGADGATPTSGNGSHDGSEQEPEVFVSPRR